MPGDNPLKCASPGELVAFGSYPQTAEGTDRTPIQWRVLQNAGGELFLLSEYALDCKRYHGESADITWWDCVDMTWRDCTLRRWLNKEFYHEAFSAEEQGLIISTHCAGNGEGTPDTEDRVFLLSADEIKEFSGLLGKELRRTVGTDFAQAIKPDGCKLVLYNKGNKNNYVAINGKEVGCCWWWLRTQGNKPSRAYFVGTDFSIRSYGNNSINGYGVRPAIQLNLK